ncbi:MAG: hypothetical protein HY927_13320 [Elusimicrobia bacterium]|nr:hypothetical protein [Elusimicrobiota bacterium]
MRETWDKPVGAVRIDWAFVLAVACFWNYGLFNGCGTRSGVLGILVTACLAGLVLFYLAFCKGREAFQDAVTVRVSDLCVIASYLLVMLLLCRRDLGRCLEADELYHAQYSQVHAVKLIRLLGQAWGVGLRWTYSRLILAVDWVALGAAVAGWAACRKMDRRLQAFVVVVAFLAVRCVAGALCGNPEPHPPLRLLPLWLSSSLLTCTDAAFRLPQLVGLVGLMWFAHRTAEKTMASASAWLFGLALGTMPILRFVGVLVEPSIWTAAAGIIVLLSMRDQVSGTDARWVRLASLVALLALMRTPAFVGALAVSSMLFLERCGGMGRTWLAPLSSACLKAVAWVLSPLAAMVPSVIFALAKGTPATYTPGEVDWFLPTTTIIGRAWFAVSSGIAPLAIRDAVGVAWLALSAFAFIPASRKEFPRTMVVAVFFLAGFCMFYAITTGLWGGRRYQAEYVAPFCILGLFRALRLLGAAPRLRQPAILVFLFSVIVMNLSDYGRVSRTIARAEAGRLVRESRLSCDYRPAHAEILKSGFAGSTYTVGVVYGNFGSIMHGYSVSQALDEFDILASLMKVNRAKGLSDVITFNTADIDQDPRIRLVLIDFATSAAKRRYRAEFEGLGWRHWRDFANPDDGAVITGMARDGQGGVRAGMAL